MKKPYSKISYEITLFELDFADVLTMSSDRENAYIDSGELWGGDWKDFGDYDD